MTSKVSVVSDVYGQFGRPPVNSLSPQNNLDIVASNLYDMEVPAILCEFDYPVARAYKTLTELSEPPKDNNYTHAFELPTDMLLFLYPDTLNYDYKIMGSEMWTNATTVSIYYVKWDDEIDKGFNPVLTKYLFFKMCSLLAYPITNKLDMMTFWEKKADAYYGVVSTTVAREEPNPVIADNEFVRMFRGGDGQS